MTKCLNVHIILGKQSGNIPLLFNQLSLSVLVPNQKQLVFHNKTQWRTSDFKVQKIHVNHYVAIKTV